MLSECVPASYFVIPAYILKSTALDLKGEMFKLTSWSVEFVWTLTLL